MRKIKEQEWVSCGVCGKLFNSGQVWDSTLPDGTRCTYGLVPEHTTAGEVCEGQKLAVLVTKR